MREFLQQLLEMPLPAVYTAGGNCGTGFLIFIRELLFGFGHKPVHGGGSGYADTVCGRIFAHLPHFAADAGGTVSPGKADGQPVADI